MKTKVTLPANKYNQSDAETISHVFDCNVLLSDKINEPEIKGGSENVSLITGFITHNKKISTVKVW